MPTLISELSCAVLSPSRHRLQMKVPEIKKILTAKGLPRTGSKADLIATYLSNVGMTTLTFICLRCVLCWCGHLDSQRADAAEITMRVAREVTRAKARNVFTHMMAATKDPASQLALPTPGALARTRALQKTTSKNTNRGRGKAPNKRISKTPASVLYTSLPLTTSSQPYDSHTVLQKRMAEFPTQPFSLCGPKDSHGNGSKLFCDACVCEVALVKSTITDHCDRNKHKNNIIMKAHMKKDPARIDESMKSIHKEVI
jgi:hypothetical protein